LKKITFLHVADVHLDSMFTDTHLSLEKAHKRRMELRACFSRICGLAVQHQVDLLLIAGDLYEHKHILESTVFFLKETFERLSPIPILICGGNHDPVMDDWVHKELGQLNHVTFFGEHGVYLDAQKQIAVYAEGFTDFYKLEKRGSLKEKIGFVHSENINLFLSHGSLDIDVGKYKYNPLSSDELESLGMDYIALGHFHNRFGDLNGKHPVYNPGSPEPLGFDEEGSHGVYLVSIVKDHERLERQIAFIPTNQRQYRKVVVDITGLRDEEACIQKVKDLTEDIPKEDFLSISLEGFLDFTWDTENIKRAFSDFFYIKIKDASLMDLDLEDLEEDQTIKGEFVRRMLSEIRKAKETDLEKKLWNALYIGLEVMRRGTVDVDRYFRPE
jgi:DNA repair protein SbcD/Mre11